MSQGLEVTNDSGAFQITESFRNYHLVESGTFSVTGTSSPHTFTRSSLTAPLLALRSTSNRVGQSSGTFSSGNLSTVIQGPMGTSAQTVSFWLFDVATSNPVSFGLEVSNSAGALIYSSGIAPLRIIATVNVSGFTNATATYASGRTYAAIQTVSGHAQDTTDLGFGYQNRSCMGMASWSSATIDARRNFTDTLIQDEINENVPGLEFTGQAPGWIIVDVTNF